MGTEGNRHNGVLSQEARERFSQMDQRRRLFEKQTGEVVLKRTLHEEPQERSRLVDHAAAQDELFNEIFKVTQMRPSELVYAFVDTQGCIDARKLAAYILTYNVFRKCYPVKYINPGQVRTSGFLIDRKKVDPEALKDLEKELYGYMHGENQHTNAHDLLSEWWDKGFPPQSLFPSTTTFY